MVLWQTDQWTEMDVWSTPCVTGIQEVYESRDRNFFRTQKHNILLRMRTLEQLQKRKLSLRKAHIGILRDITHVVQEKTLPTFIFLSQTLYIGFRLHYFGVTFTVTASSQEQLTEVCISATHVVHWLIFAPDICP